KKVSIGGTTLRLDNRDTAASSPKYESACAASYEAGERFARWRSIIFVGGTYENLTGGCRDGRGRRRRRLSLAGGDLAARAERGEHSKGDRRRVEAQSGSQRQAAGAVAAGRSEWRTPSGWRWRRTPRRLRRRPLRGRIGRRHHDEQRRPAA